MRLIARFCDLFIEGGLIFLIISTPLAFGTVEVWSLGIAELAVVGMTLAWILKMACQGEVRFAKRPVNLPILLFLGVVVLQIIVLPMGLIKYLSPAAHAIYAETQMVNPQGIEFRTLSLFPYATTQEFFKILTYALLFGIVINHYQQRRKIERIVRIIIMMGFLLAVFGIIQRYTWNGKIYWFRELTKGGKPFGPFVHANHFAGYIEMVIPLTMGYLMARPPLGRRRFSTWRERIRGWASYGNDQSVLVLFSGLVMASALWLSGSRGGLLAFFGSMVYVAIMMWKDRPSAKRIWYLIAFVMLAFMASLWVGTEQVLQTIQRLRGGSEDPSVRGRLGIWSDTLRIVRDYPLFGIGLGTFAWVYPAYKNLRDQFLFTHVENDYLQLLAETGATGFGIVVWGFALLYGAMVRGWFAAHDRIAKGMGIGTLAGITAMLIHGLFDFNFHIYANMSLFVILTGLGFNLLKKTDSIIHQT